MIEEVYIVEHSREIGECDETKFIGVFFTKEKAEEIVEQYKKLSGFKEHPDDFFIEMYEINKSFWQEGFTSQEWLELEGVPSFLDDLENNFIKIDSTLKQYYNLNNLPSGPGSELSKIRYWKENNEK